MGNSHYCIGGNATTPMISIYSARRVSRRGQTLVEYALILAFIAVVAIAVLVSLGGTVKKTFASVNTQLATAKNGGTIVQE
jgi:Flp pilus assembly pilin Flp